MNEPTIIIGKEFADKVIPLISRARKSIDIIVFDWKWYPDQIGSAIQRFNNAIIDARNRGKKVRVITNKQYTVNTLSNNKINAQQWTSKKNLHTKLMIIDNEIIIIGSHNYTMNAFALNHEVSIIIQNTILTERLEKYFENLWQL